MSKILICDDETGIRKVIKKYALFEGYEVVEAENGMIAVKLCTEQIFDIIIMDVMMPELDGFSAVKEIRRHSDVPIIMLTARGEEYDKVLGFELGIDDYMIKPFSSKEVMLRVNAILRRVTNVNKIEEVKHIIFKKDELKVDLTAHKVFINEIEVTMPPKAYELLFFLIRNKNIALTREQILQEVWGYEYYGDDRTLDTHMKILRKALGNYSTVITTLRGLGYRLDE